MTSALIPTAPICPLCRKPHVPRVKCWRGRYAHGITTTVLALQGTTCWLCGKPGATTTDHVVPRSLGGTDEWANLRPAHQACNARRRNADPFPEDPEPQPRRIQTLPLSPRWLPHDQP